MVCTRKKDYGEAPLKQRRTAAAQQYVTRKTDDRGNYLEFTLFPKLPGELRDMIWKESMTPRLVVVEPSGIVYMRCPAYTKKVLPAQLCVNSESRFWALRRYSLRFTITLIVNLDGQHTWDCHNFRGSRHHANVVMSPDDTLGLLGWDCVPHGVKQKLQVESVNWDSPWMGNWPNTSSGGAQPEVKKVAFLGRKLGSRAEIIHALNSTVSWDVNTILHADSTKLRRRTLLAVFGTEFRNHSTLWAMS